MSSEIIEMVDMDEKSTQIKEFEERNPLVISERLENELKLINERFNSKDNVVMKVLKDNQTASFLKVKNLSEAGLSILNNDYYIVPMGNNVNIEPSYMGLVKVAINEALKRGFEIIVKSDTVSNSDEVKIITENEIDNLSISKNPLDNSIKGAYALISIVKNGNLLYRKAEFLNKEQIDTIKSKTFSKEGKVYKEFPEEMARKSAIRRAIKHINYFIKSDVLDGVISIDNENYNFSNSNLKAIDDKKEQINNSLKELQELKTQYDAFIKENGISKKESEEFIIKYNIFTKEKFQSVLANKEKAIKTIKGEL
ncbi:recombinase RecT [Campylobacter coli]|nr:recombinase RecT [Campylobacter coli]EDO6953091.1 recombinase RecT [Campylobacter coli]HEF9166470.1 recombinase RecT [Campylobacter coli]HEF9245607.1 recombinase RecT [Campylobacter coli]